MYVFENRNWCGRLISERTKGLYTELNERAEVATGSYSAPGNVYNIFILCLWLRIIRGSNLGVWFMNFPSQMFLTILDMVTEQLYWRKILCVCFRYLWLWLLLAIMKRYAERCARKLYRTSLICSLQRQGWTMKCFFQIVSWNTYFTLISLCKLQQNVLEILWSMKILKISFQKFLVRERLFYWI